MDLTDLVGIGRLGGPDAEGFFQVLVKPRYFNALAAADEVFLIFNSDRVFFVTISERDISDRKIRIRFAEDGVAEERKRHKEVTVALEREPQTAEEPDDLLDFTVVFEGREVGKVTGFFHNNAQYVLVVTTSEDREIMIPLVDYFVGEIIPDPGVVVLTNAESLLRSALEEE